jgi:hypothetical protein
MDGDVAPDRRSAEKTRADPADAVEVREHEDME